MRKILISEWSVGEQSGRLLMVTEATNTNQQIILELSDNEQAGTVQFDWEESESVIEGIAEILITKNEQSSEERIVGMLCSDIENIFFGWSALDSKENCGVMIAQGDEKIIIKKSGAVEFFRWIRNSLQLMGRIVS